MLLRRHRIICSLILLVAMMFTQLAVAAHACPDLAPAAMQMQQMQDERAGASCYVALDPDAPHLCWQHSQSDKQAAYHADAPGANPVFVIRYLVPSLTPELSGSMRTARSYAPLLTRSVEPPVSIRNCCFRI